jgi:hypothetical protein
MSAFVLGLESAGWIHRRQQTVIEFLKANNGSLKEQLAGK